MQRSALTALVASLVVLGAARAEPPQLFYLARIDGGVALRASGPLGGEQRTVREFREAKGPQWSPDGHYIAFVQSGEGDTSERLFVVDCLTGQATPANTASQRVLGYGWSERSDRIFFFSGKPEDTSYELYARDMTPNGAAVRLGPDLHALAVSPISSSDGRWVAFAVADARHPRQVAIADAQTGAARIVSGDLMVDGHTWARQRSLLTLLARTAPSAPPGLWVVDPAGGEPRRLSAEGQHVRGFSWRPTGDAVAYMVAVGTPEEVTDRDGNTRRVPQLRTWVYMARPDESSPAARVDAIADAVRFQWSPSGASFVVADQAHAAGAATVTLRVGALEGPLSLPMLVRNSTGSLYESWAPDGSRLMFVQEGNVYVFEPAALRSRLLVNSIPVRELTWSPKSDAVLLIAPYDKGGFTAWRVDASQGKGRPVSHAFAQGALDWAPDGQALMLVIPRDDNVSALYCLDSTATAPPDPATCRLSEAMLSATWYPKE